MKTGNNYASYYKTDESDEFKLLGTSTSTMSSSDKVNIGVFISAGKSPESSSITSTSMKFNSFSIKVCILTSTILAILNGDACAY